MDTQIKELANGVKYFSCGYLSFGDYDNSCAVERANVRYLKEKDELKDSIDKWSMDNWERGDYLSSSHRSIGGFSTWQPIESDTKLVEAYGGYGSIQLWVREDIWNELELEKEFDSYPALDDDLVSQIEMEMEDEAWENSIKSDLINTLPDDYDQDQLDNQEVKCMNCLWEGIDSELIIELDVKLCPKCSQYQYLKHYDIESPTLRDFADQLDNDKLWTIYRYCCDQTNTYGECESGGNWYIDTDKLKDKFKETIEQYIEGKELCQLCNGSGYGQFMIQNACMDCNGIGFAEYEESNDNKQTEPTILNFQEN